MRKTRTIVAVTLLATALCADRAVASAAAQASRVEAGSATPSRSFAQRLTGSLRRVVPAVKLSPARTDAVVTQVVVTVLGGEQARPHAIQGDAFPFRLPPPTR